MCLAEVTGTPKKIEGLGWKVFEIIKASGKLRPTHQARNTVYDYGVWYQATPIVQKFMGASVPVYPLKTERNGQPFEEWYANRKQYRNGFHIFLRREDARDFVSRNPGNTVVRQVEYRQAHTLGSGVDANQYRGAASGPQVVAEEIKILKPRAGGSAYAKAKKAEKQVPAATV